MATKIKLTYIMTLLAEDPLLERPEHALLARQVEQMFDKAGAMN